MGDAVRDDHSRQIVAEDYVLGMKGRGAPIRNVLDLGCADGSTRKLFAEVDPNIEWFGVDIAQSPEVTMRQGQFDRIVTYNGTDLPFMDAAFDLVYSCQVLEHVRHPDELMREVSRVLKPGGLLAGSVAYLEPYHSYSIFNFTPYGLATVLRDAGLKPLEIRPGIDGVSLILRQFLGAPRIFNLLNRRSPAHIAIGGIGRLMGLDHRHINYLKLHLSGHLCFLAEKAAGCLGADS